jgi:hypothetical protein
VVQEAVEDADGGGVFGQEAAPLFEGPVGSAALIAGICARPYIDFHEEMVR